MAETDKSQKTEDPTGKRLEEAHRKGDIAKSQEINHWFMLAGAGLVLLLFAGGIAGAMRGGLTVFLEQPHRIATDFGALAALFADFGFDMLALLSLPLLVLMLAAIVGNMVQHRPVFAVERMKPELRKLSPLNGAKRMFGAKGFIDVGKALGKIAVIGAISFVLVWPQIQILPLLPTVELIEIVQIIFRIALTMLAGILGAMTVLAALDFAYQRYDWFQNQKMTRQEVKDETKQSEGDPQVKARIRQIRSDRARKRIAQAVPTADVVITNPTHFAVALQYDGDQMAAPRCVAKGLDLLAVRIRELAREHDVPIVENPPLARALYAGVEIDDEIPPHFYQAVAEVIGYVMRVRDRLGRRRRPRQPQRPERPERPERPGRPERPEDRR